MSHSWTGCSGLLQRGHSGWGIHAMYQKQYRHTETLDLRQHRMWSALINTFVLTKDHGPIPSPVFTPSPRVSRGGGWSMSRASHFFSGRQWRSCKQTRIFHLHLFLLHYHGNSDISTNAVYLMETEKHGHSHFAHNFTWSIKSSDRKGTLPSSPGN